LNHLTVPVILSDIVFASFGKRKDFRRPVRSIGGQTKQPTDSNRELWLFF